MDSLIQADVEETNGIAVWRGNENADIITTGARTLEQASVENSVVLAFQPAFGINGSHASCPGS